MNFKPFQTHHTVTGGASQCTSCTWQSKDKGRTIKAINLHAKKMLLQIKLDFDSMHSNTDQLTAILSFSVDRV